MTAQDRKTAQRIAHHINSLGSLDAKVAQDAETYLMRYYGVRALEPLIEACASEDVQTRFRAVWVLAHTRDVRAYETVLRLTRDPDASVRYDAAIGLGRLGDAHAVEPLIALLQKPDEQNAVDSAAAMGLERLGETAVPALSKVAKNGKGYARKMAISALGGIGGAEATELLRKLALDDDGDVRMAAEEALEEMADALKDTVKSNVC